MGIGTGATTSWKLIVLGGIWVWPWLLLEIPTGPRLEYSDHALRNVAMVIQDASSMVFGSWNPGRPSTELVVLRSTDHHNGRCYRKWIHRWSAVGRILLLSPAPEGGNSVSHDVPCHQSFSFVEWVNHRNSRLIDWILMNIAFQSMISNGRITSQMIYNTAITMSLINHD